MKSVTIRLRMGSHDGHYAGGLVDGAKILQLFGDVATELLIRRDGDEGLFRAYESVEFLVPVRAGDFIEATGKILSEGKTSRRMEFEAYKVIELTSNSTSSAKVKFSESAANVLDPPLLVCKAIGTCVTPVALQRNGALVKNRTGSSAKGRLNIKNQKSGRE